MPIRSAEVVTTGIDETLQGVGGDPFNGRSRVGLRVPTLPTASVSGNPLQNRYLFNLASIAVPIGGHAHLRGWRMLVTLGVNTGSAGSPRIVEQEVTTPFWRFPDGNISWHLMNLGPPAANGSYGGFGPAGSAVVSGGNTIYTGNQATGAPTPIPSAYYRFAPTSAFLYESVTIPTSDPFYIDLVNYTAPFQGRPLGVPLIHGGVGSMLDKRIDWGYGADVWDRLDITVRPTTIALFASVRQSNPATRIAVTPPGLLYPNGLSVEEQFLLNYPNAIYWSVAASLTVDVITPEKTTITRKGQ